MPIILNIETATEVCSVALAGAGKIMGLKESTTKNAHSSVITQFIEEVLKTAGTVISSLDAIAVSEGPGSYTGLRIGVATAKGLCYALNKPLIVISTLKAMASGIQHPASSIKHPLLYCPMVDARRMEVYCAMFDEKLNEVRETRAEIINENSFSELLKDHRIIFGGNGAEKCRNLIGHHENAVFLDDFHASAKYMIALSEEKFQNHQFEEPAYFEPFYLKDFVAGKPRVKGLF